MINSSYSLKQHNTHIGKALLFAILMLLGAGNLFANTDCKILPTPEWVEKITNDSDTTHQDEAIANGFAYLLVDNQTKVSNGNAHYYYHRTKKILNNKGMQQSSDIKVDFDPSSHEAILHKVEIIRNGETINCLQANNVKVVQRETELESKLFTGEQTLLVFLEGVRSGDIIEYSYSMIGKNQKNTDIFIYDFFVSSATTPVALFRDQLILPKDYKLAIKNHSSNHNPIIRNVGNNREYVWTVKNTPVIALESSIPDWFNPFPRIQVTEKKSWQEIAKNKLLQYATPTQISAQLDAYIKRIAENINDPGERLIAVARFIQDEVRYMGIANLDRGSPTEPSVTFRRRFGDCKDKTVLMLAILKALHIEAYTALVDTTEGEAMNHLLPSTNAFNHAIVVAYINGKKYWIDPTQSYQGGSLENLSQPNYGYALILNPKTTSLAKLPALKLNAPTERVYETFDLQKGAGAPGTFKVKTIYTGHSADEKRERLTETPKKILQEEYLKYYEKFYPDIKQKQEMKITDNRQQNQIIIEEVYEINDVWTKNETDKQHIFEYSANELRPYLDSSYLTTRKMPLAIAHPVHISKEINLLLPKTEWNLPPVNLEINAPEFNFKNQESYKNHVYSIRYEFKTLKDHVKPKDLEVYKHNLKKALLFGNIFYDYGETVGSYTADTSEDPEATQWQVSSDFSKQKSENDSESVDDNNENDSLNFIAVLLVLLVIVITLFIIIWFNNLSSKKTINIPENTRYQGLGGWLVLIAFQLFLTFAMQIYAFKEIADTAFSTQIWNALTVTSSAAFNPLWAPVILAELIANTVFIVVSLFAIFLFFKKNHRFPRIYILLMWSILVLAIADDIAVFYISTDFNLNKELLSDLKNLFGYCMWTWYMLVSKRVKATFIHQ